MCNYLYYFSVIICTYNRVKTLPKCIDSILSQTFQDLEIIIFDDGSFDETKKTLNNYKNNDVKLFYNKENKGVIYCRNNAIKLSNGKYIAFVDSDDWILPNHFEIRKNILEKEKCDFLHGGFKLLGNEFVIDRFDNTKKISIYDCILDSTLIFRKKDLEKLGLFPDLNYASGNELHKKATEYGLRCFNVKEETYIYNRNLRNSITKNRNKE